MSKQNVEPFRSADYDDEDQDLWIEDFTEDADDLQSCYDSEFEQYYDELLEGSYDCVDRIVINAYYRMGQTAGGFRWWWRDLEGNEDRLNDTQLMRMAGRFSRRVRGWGKANQIPVIDCGRGDRKFEIAREYLPSDPAFVGIFLVLVSKAPGPVWQVKRTRIKGAIDLKRKDPWPYVNHYSFHIMDPQWGHICIMMSGHPPFGAMILLNGHEWVERQAKKQAIEITKEENCFTASSNFQALGQIADSLHSQSAVGCLTQVCDAWIYSACLCFGLDMQEQQRSNFRYNYSVYQMEYSRNLLFKSSRKMEELYQRVSTFARCIPPIRGQTIPLIRAQTIPPIRGQAIPPAARRSLVVVTAL